MVPSSLLGSTLRLNPDSIILVNDWHTSSLPSQLTPCLDTAQSYGNELETGVAIKLSDLKREQLFITTKFSGRKDVETSIKDSLNYVSDVDS